MDELEFRFRAVSGDHGLARWADGADFSPLGRGCEGSVTVASYGGERYRRKRYLRRSEFVRQCIGGRLLAACLRSHGWDRYVDLPPMLAVDPTHLCVLARYVPAVSSESDRGPALAAARTAMLCAAGRADAFDPARRRVEIADLVALGIRDEEWLGLNGVDLSDANLVDDGARWWAIDF